MLDAVKRVYTGKAGCACGCRGKHSDNRATIKRTLALMEKRIADGGDVVFYSYGYTDSDGVSGFVSVDYETESGAMRSAVAYR